MAMSDQPVDLAYPPEESVVEPGRREAQQAGSPSRTFPDALALMLLLLEGTALLLMLRGLIGSPLSFDEQWRAYYISLGSGLWEELHTSSAPFAAGWIGLEWAAAALLGTTEWALRLPMAVAIPGMAMATYWLARRWLGPVTGFLVAALLMANCSVLVYGLLLKPFVFDGLWTVVAVLLWLYLDGTSVRWPVQLLGYLGLGLITVAAIPTVFVLGPLLVLGLIRAARGSFRQLLGQLGLTVLTIGLVAVHLITFIVPQSQIVNGAYWVRHFAPLEQGVVPLVRFVWHQLAGYLPEMVTSTYLPPDVEDPLWHQATKVPPSHSLGLLVSAGLLVALVAGTSVLLRSRDGRALLVAVSGAVAGQLAGSLLHKWPFGLVRANLFLLPLLYVVAGIGATRLTTSIWASPRRVARLAAVPMALLVVAGVTVGGGYGARNLTSLYQQWDVPGLASHVRSAVAIVRSHAAPEDLVIVTGDQRGWSWYMERYRGFPPLVDRSPRIPTEQTLHSAVFRRTQVDPWLAAHRQASSVFVFEFVYRAKARTSELIEGRRRRLASLGWCPVRRWEFPLTGFVTQYHRGTGCSGSGETAPNPSR
jgi:4-amino-4-deoxy-L-arabinose transferase-like glycosyltransferase